MLPELLLLLRELLLLLAELLLLVRELEVLCAITGHLPAGRRPAAAAALLLATALRDLLRCLLRALADTLDGLPGALSDLAERLVRALPDALDGLARALSDLTDRLAGSLAQLTHALARALADVLNRALGALADVLDRVAGVFEGVAGTGAHVPHRPPDAREQLRVAVERQRHAIQNRADVVSRAFSRACASTPSILSSTLPSRTSAPTLIWTILRTDAMTATCACRSSSSKSISSTLTTGTSIRTSGPSPIFLGIADGVVVVFLSFERDPLCLRSGLA